MVNAQLSITPLHDVADAIEQEAKAGRISQKDFQHLQASVSNRLAILLGQRSPEADAA